MSETLKTLVKKDPRAFMGSLSPADLRMFTSQLISHYFVMNFFGYSSIKSNFKYLPIKKLQTLVKTSMLDDELIKILEDNFDLYYKDFLVLMSQLESSEELEFILNIPDKELKKIVMEVSPDVIVSAFNNADVKLLGIFAMKIENFEVTKQPSSYNNSWMIGVL